MNKRYQFFLLIIQEEQQGSLSYLRFQILKTNKSWDFLTESQLCCNAGSNSRCCLFLTQPALLISAINSPLLDNNTYFLNDVNKYSGTSHEYIYGARVHVNIKF